MLKLTRSQQAQLADLADATICRTLAGEESVPAAANLFEAIGATVSAALPSVGDAWRSMLRPLGVRVNAIGAFSFGCPKVELVDNGVPRRCDLATILAIVDDLTGPVPDRRALLLGSRLRGAKEDPVQRRLFAEWPPFRLADPIYRDSLRDMRSSGIQPAGCFAEIDLARRESVWRLLAPTRTGRTRPRGTLGSALAAMACGVGGGKATARGLDDWSQTVHELLNRSARATMIGLSAQPEVRSATTYRGESGSGFVVFENREGLPLESALAKAVSSGPALVEAPISVVHVVFRDVDGPDQPAPGPTLQ